MPLSGRTMIKMGVVGMALFALAGAQQVRAAAEACDPALACFDVSLFPANLTGDVYVDGTLAAAQTNAARVSTSPGTAHQVEVRNIQDPAAPGFNDLFRYPDLSQPNLFGFAGQARRLVFYPVRQFVKGILDFTCDPRGRKASDNVVCRPVIDGAAQADVAAGARAQYNFPPGAHAVHTDLVGDQAGNWSPTSRDDTVTIYAGRRVALTTYQRAVFTLKGLLKITLFPAGVLGDIYVDGALAASQAAAADAFVSPGVHTVEARAIADPAATGVYRYADVSQPAAVFAAGTRFVRLYPQKTWLKGFLTVTCQVNRRGPGDDVQCLVSSDGAQIGAVAAGQRGTFNLPTGAHAISVAAGGAQGGGWDGPVSATLNMIGGRAVFYIARFNPKPTPAPVTGGGTTGGQPGVNHLGTEKVVLADYMMWYGPDNFNGSQTWDVPAAGAYNSDDYGTIQRQVAQAQQACLNGLAAHWYGPVDGRTTNNFNQLLRASAGTGLRHAVVVQTNILPGVSEQTIIDAVNYAIANWAQGPNYLRLGGKPVIIFTDMPRPWGNDGAAQEGWARIRAAADPNHTTIWMAEGLYPTFNPLFDGLYIYRIDHRDYPQSWVKQKRWADGLRAVERRGNLPLGGLYFADTIAAGFDDTRSVNAPGDLRSDAPHFARDRRNGGYYADTFAATANTGGDFLLVKSFNEWIEGTEIEPGAAYGDLYLNLTCQYANAYRGR